MVSPYTVHLPEALNTLLAKVAQASGETNEAILLDWIANPVTIPTIESLDEFLEQIKSHTQIQLWTLVERSLDNLKQVAGEMREFTEKSKDSVLSDEETETLDNLADLYDLYTLLRSKALGLLIERGQDVQEYLERNAPQ